MNIQIDTTNKIFKLQESVNLKELFEILEKLFPNKEWLEYRLETNTIITNWETPLIIDRWGESYPWWNSPTYSSNRTKYIGFDTGDGVYNLVIN